MHPFSDFIPCLISLLRDSLLGLRGDGNLPQLKATNDESVILTENIDDL